MDAHTSHLSTLKEPWKSPPVDRIKINFDRVYDASAFRSTFGVVARNHKGRILCSCLDVHERVAFAFVAEALAYHKAICLGLEMG